MAFAHWFAICLLILAQPALAAPDGPPLAVTAAVLRDFPPLYRLDKQGQPEGFAIDILKQVEAAANLKVSYLLVDNWAEAMQALREKRADFIPGIGISPERSAEFLFSKEMEAIPVSIFVRAENRSITRIASLAGRRTAVIDESAAFTHLLSSKDIQLVTFSDIAPALFALLAGEVDAFVFPRPVLLQKARLLELDERIKVVGEPVIELKRGYLLRKDAQALVERLNPAIYGFVTSEAYGRALNTWYGKPRPFWTVGRLALVSALLLLAVIGLMAAWRYFSIIRLNRSLVEARDALAASNCALQLNEGRLNAMLNLSELAPSMSEREILQHGLEEAQRLTSSEISYLHFINDDQQTIQLSTWSTNTLKHCQAAFDNHYPVEKAGIWADTVRFKQAVVHNDYQYMADRRGYPEGHAHLLRHMATPVMEDDQVRIILGVGNKPTLYDDADLRQLQLIGDSLWKIVSLRRTIIDLEQAHDATKASELRYRTIADYTYDWEGWIAPDGNWLYCSPACERVTGYDAEEFTTDPGHMLSIIHPDDRELWLEHVDPQKHHPDLNNVLTFRVIRKTGEIRWIEHNCRPVIRAERDFLGRRLVNRDVTARKQQEQELRQKDALLHHQSRFAAMGEMIGNIAHQWRQPLTVLGLVMQNMRYDLEVGLLGEADIRSYETKVLKTIEQMSGTIDDFRNFFKPRLQPEIFGPVPVIFKCIDLMGEGLKVHNIDIQVSGPHELEAFGYPGELSQVMINLLVNAKDAIVERHVPQGRIEISVTANMEGVRITVEDNAGGISGEHLDKIFDPYFTTKATGTGIGLYMSRTIVEHHLQGMLRVENTESGARFTLDLPSNLTGTTTAAAS